MLPSEKEVSRRIPCMGIQVMTHSRVMVVPIRGLRREVIVMVHGRTWLSSRDVSSRGPTSCNRRRHCASSGDLVPS